MVNKPYDFIIIGSGLYGATFACLAKRDGKRCLVIEKRKHLGGNVYCENIDGINVHKYGPHVFHTSNKPVWDFVNQFCRFNRFTLSPIANNKGECYNLPFNMNTFHQMWGVSTPSDAKVIIEQQKYKGEVLNLEDQAKALVGTDIYEKLIKGYTEKQWGRPCTELPPFIIRRLPLRFSFDNNYFNDKYQGIPIGGYNKLIDGMLEGIECKTSTEFSGELYKTWRDLASNLVYTGKIDEFYHYRFGKLQYRSLRFEHEELNLANYQGVAQMNFTDDQSPYTRIIEHKHFESFGDEIYDNARTIITREFSTEHSDANDAYYPINDIKNNELYEQYKRLAEQESDILFGGRLAEYRYYNMEEVINNGMCSFHKLRTNG